MTIDQSKIAIVNLVTNNPVYKKGQERLITSLKHFAPKDIKVDVFAFVGEESVYAPQHTSIPYGFKISAISFLRKLGYDMILWLDASIVAVADYSKIFEMIKVNGIFLEDSGWTADRWTNDNALNYFGITREQAKSVRMFSAGFIGFDFTNPKARAFFQIWLSAMKHPQNPFSGSWSDHRHDMSAGSIIANQLGLDPLMRPCKEFFSYVGSGYEINPASPFHLLGI